MREETSVTIQPHQILRLPHRMARVLDPRYIWNVIYSARSNRCHDPTSRNTAPATQNDSHAWSSSHMKRHLQRAEQQVSPSNLTKYCACHTEWLTCLILVTYETSFTVRGASGVTIQPHEILRLPHRMTRMLDRRHMWNVFYNAQSIKSHHPTSPNTAPATQNGSRAWLSSHMKRHLQCAEQQMSPSNLTKYRACHTKWLACLIVVTYETSLTTRGAAGVTIQPHQILRLPHRMTHMLDPRYIWNVIYSARSIRCHDPTSRNTAPATQNDSHAWSSSHMKRLLQCAEQQVSPSNLTKYCACHTEWLACLIVVTYETSFTMRGATGVTIKPHQIPRLPHKMTRMLDRRHIWNLISNAGSNRYHDPTSRNTAPATQNDSHAWSSSHMKPHFQCAEQQVSRSNLTKYCACHTKWLACLIVVTYETSFPMRGATGITIQPHQILRLARTMTLQDFKENLQKQMKRHFQCGADPTMIRAWSEHDPTMIRPWKRKPQPASQVSLLFEVPRSIFYCKIQRFAPILHSNLHQILRLPQKDTLDLHQVLHLPRKVTLEPHEIPRLPHKMTRMLDRRHIWNLISNARSNRYHDPTSPNTAPATQNDSHAWSSSHMKPHFQCAEQQVSRSNLTKYCAWHEQWHCKISKKISKNRWNVISNAGPIRPWSEHDPWSDHENANRNPPRKWACFSRSPEAFSIVKYNVSPPILHSNLHQILRLPQKDTLDLHQVLHLPRKVTLELHQVLRLPRKMTSSTSASIAPATNSDTWTSASTAPATKSDTWTSPSTAPATVL